MIRTTGSSGSMGLTTVCVEVLGSMEYLVSIVSVSDELLLMGLVKRIINMLAASEVLLVWVKLFPIRLNSSFPWSSIFIVSASLFLTVHYSLIFSSSLLLIDLLCFPRFRFYPQDTHQVLRRA